MNPEYDPLWAAAQDLAMPLSLHIGTNRPGPDEESPITGSLSDFTNIDHWVRMSLSNIIFAGVFRRYPKLQVGSIEMELSWVPHFLDRMDYNYTQRALGAFRQRLASQRLFPPQRIPGIPRRPVGHQGP